MESLRQVRILLLEQDPQRAGHLASQLRAAGHEVGGPFPDKVPLHLSDLAIVGSGDHDEGLALLRRLRRAGVTTLLLSREDSLASRLEGLAAGATDVVQEPYEMNELLARIDAIARRTAGSAAGRMMVGDLVVDARQHLVFRNGQALELTRLEFLLLAELCRRPGHPVGKRRLLSSVWGDPGLSENVLEVRIGKLRRKLEAHGPRLINTVRGFGYVLEPPLPTPGATGADPT